MKSIVFLFKAEMVAFVAKNLVFNTCIVVICLAVVADCLQMIDRCTLMDHCDYQIMRESMDCANYINKGHSVYYTIRHRHVKASALKSIDSVENATSAGDIKESSQQIEHLYCRVRFITCTKCFLNVSIKLIWNQSNDTTKQESSQNCSYGYNVYTKDFVDEKSFQVNSTIEEILLQSQSNWLQITSFHDKNILAICTLTLLIKSSVKNSSAATTIQFNRPIARMEENRVLNNLMLVACLSGIGFIMLISGLILIRIFTQNNNATNINRQAHRNMFSVPPSPSHMSDQSEWSTVDEWPSQQQQLQVVDYPPSYDEIRKQESPPPTYVVAAEKFKKLSAQVFRLSVDKLPTTANIYQVNKNKQKRKRITRSLEISHKKSISIPSNLVSLPKQQDRMVCDVNEKKKMQRSADYLQHCVSIESSDDDLRCGCDGACSCSTQRYTSKSRRRTSSLSPTSLAVASRIINSRRLSQPSSPDFYHENCPSYSESFIPQFYSDSSIEYD